jgi:N utilization substance protein B
MSIARTSARIKAMTCLYQINLYKKGKIDYDINKIIEENGMIENEFVCSLVKGVIDKEKELDRIANKYLNKWTINRLGLTDQAILKIGIYELLYTDTPKKVCIDEAVELSKNYSDEAVSKMINGVLDKIYHNECDE